MKFIETNKEAILGEGGKKNYNRELEQDLREFLATGYQYAKVEDTEGRYNNNNDLRRAIQRCIKSHDLPMIVFMYRGITYVERLEEKDS